jgi:phosphate transport system ATP-binding protein
MSGAIEARGLHLWYGEFRALHNLHLEIAEHRITSLIGPSGCGKSTLLRCFNRMNERFGGVRIEGSVCIHGHAPDVSLVELRKAVGMVFQRPNPLPISIEENVLFGLRAHLDAPPREQQAVLVEEALREVDLWSSVRDKLKKTATELPLEQQEKLCIARLLLMKPSVILMDEPCSALDASGTRAVEELMQRLAEAFTVVIVTHNMAQARRVSEDCVFMLHGEIVERGSTQQIFQSPEEERTRVYIAGRYA